VLRGPEPAAAEADVEPETILMLPVWYAVFLLSATCHEAAHAWVALLGGDRTAYLGGQVSLNPLPHIRREPLGTLLMPLITFFMMGWTMGWASTPYDPHWARRHPRRQALMSAAGPVANLLVATIAFVVLRLLLVRGILVLPADTLSLSRLAVPDPVFGETSPLWAVAATLSIALTLNTVLFLFNLLPIPPMDGSGVAQGLFPDSIGRFMESLRGNPMMALLGLLVAWRVFPFIADPVFDRVLGWLYAGFSPGSEAL